MLLGDAFPGRSCPGLIEAAFIRVPFEAAPEVFRGEAAPASLKQGRHGVPLFGRGAVSGAKLPRPH